MIKHESEKYDTRYEYTRMNVYKKGILIYNCICYEEQCSLLPYAYEYNGNDYIIFRKDLYGYTILNLNTLEEQNYFPSKVLDEHDEAFIICEAHLLKDSLLLEGCYWGGPHECFLLDLTRFKTCLLDEDKGIGCLAGGKSIKIQAGKAVIYYYNYIDDKKTDECGEISYDYLKKLLNESDTTDI